MKHSVPSEEEFDPWLSTTPHTIRPVYQIYLVISYKLVLAQDADLKNQMNV